MRYIEYFSRISDLGSNDRTGNEYESSYSTDNHRKLGFPEHVVSKALKNAIKSREFEIQMYWNRAKYFWLFVSALWVAYGKLLYDWGYLDGLFKSNLYQYSTLLVLSCAGLGLSVAWYFVNKGSKFWQENWEYQINFLENEIIGKSYKTIFSDRKINDRSEFDQSLFGSFPFSVSKINVTIAFSSAVLWLVSANIWVLLISLKAQISSKILGTSCCWLVSMLVFNLICAISACVFSKISKSSFSKHDPIDKHLVIRDEHNEDQLVAHQRIL